MTAPRIPLSDGNSIPALGLGTWQAADDPGVVEKAVEHAIDAGYRHFDCAYIYKNEEAVGKAVRAKIAEGVVKREDIFITTKLWCTDQEKNQVIPACKRSLKNFGFDYVDLYLIHWPVSYKKEENKGPRLTSGIEESAFDSADFCETWKCMEECKKLGLTKSIGLSNFNSVQIDKVLSIAKIKPVMNQIECHPNLNQKKLREFCAKRGIAITAYSPLGSPTRLWAKPGDPQVVIDTPEVVAMSEKYGKKPAQIVLRYLVEIGTIPIPKSSSEERIKQNINIFDFKLTPEEVAVIDSFNSDLRICPADFFRKSKNYPFNIEY